MFLASPFSHLIPRVQGLCFKSPSLLMAKPKTRLRYLNLILFLVILGNVDQETYILVLDLILQHCLAWYQPLTIF